MPDNWQAKNNSPSKLRVCTYNIHKGFSLGNRQFLLHQIRDAVRQLNADILLLQEVVGENKRRTVLEPQWPKEAQFEYLADSVWHHYAYGKNAVYDHGHHGNAMLSRYPFKKVQNTDLSLIPFSSRGILHAELLFGIEVFCVHFGLFYFERRKQAMRIVDLIQKNVDKHQPIIIAGDFNDWHKRIDHLLKDELGLQEAVQSSCKRRGATYPAFQPLMSMDRIYYRGINLESVHVLSGTPWNKLSDHCAVYADFSLPKSQFAQVNIG